MFKHMLGACERRFARRGFDDEGGHGGGGHGHGRGHRGGWGGWGGRGEHRERRVFDQGDLRLVLLWLIEEKPRSGYDLIKAIEELVGGAYSPSPGVIYPTLTMLEEQGSIRMTANEGTKKLYDITTEGTEFLKASAATVAAIRERIAHARARFGGEPAPQILRAMENFKLALKLRLSRGNLTTEQTQAIVDAIDTAAQTIERA